jgi:predicted peptidase
MIDAIKKAGGEPKYTEYKGVGHDAWTPTYRNSEVLDWLFEQKKGK